MTKQLSHKTQEVKKSVDDAYWLWDQMCPADANIIAAATLRAVVLQCEYCDDYGTSFIDPKDLLAIATELERQ